MTEPAIITLKEDRINYWLGEGAKPSTTVQSLFKSQGFTGAAA